MSQTNAERAYDRKYRLKRYHKKMREAKRKLGGKCRKCGATTNLQFDHVNPKSKKFALGKNWSYSESTVNREKGKTQLLCEKHNKEKYNKTPKEYAKES